MKEKHARRILPTAQAGEKVDRRMVPPGWWELEQFVWTHVHDLALCLVPSAEDPSPCYLGQRVGAAQSSRISVQLHLPSCPPRTPVSVLLHLTLTCAGIILGTHHEKGAFTFWSYAIGLPLPSSSILSWKFCHVLHKVLRDGHPNVSSGPALWPQEGQGAGTPQSRASALGCLAQPAALVGAHQLALPAAGAARLPAVSEQHPGDWRPVGRCGAGLGSRRACLACRLMRRGQGPPGQWRTVPCPCEVALCT